MGIVTIGQSSHLPKAESNSFQDPHPLEEFKQSVLLIKILILPIKHMIEWLHYFANSSLLCKTKKLQMNSPFHTQKLLNSCLCAPTQQHLPARQKELDNATLASLQKLCWTTVQMHYFHAFCMQ